MDIPIWMRRSSLRATSAVHSIVSASRRSSAAGLVELRVGLIADGGELEPGQHPFELGGRLERSASSR
jgi:hypothetical protein